MIKRALDIILSVIGIILAAPLMLLTAVLIKIDSKGPVLFTQKRVGKQNKDFNIFKFRTMCANSETKGFLTIGNKDPRITKMGYYLRQYKIDELPQLINILIGDMSFVGPRPELREFVAYYSEEDLKVLKVKPGLTSLASIKYRNEVELLKEVDDPETFYVNNILPHKLKLNKQYINNMTLFLDFKIMFMTVMSI